MSPAQSSGAQLVGEAADIEESIAAILATKPDLVLLDLRLQHGSGFQVLRAVHRAEPGIDFYVLSNFAPSLTAAAPSASAPAASCQEQGLGPGARARRALERAVAGMWL